MAEEFEIAKAVYRIEVAGLSEAEKVLDEFVKKIASINETLTNLKSGLSNATSGGNPQEISNLTAKIKELEIEIEKLQAKESAARKEVDALTAAQNANATSANAQSKATSTSGGIAEKVAGQFKTFAQAISAVSQARKEANSTNEAVQIKGVQDDNLKASVFSASQLEDIEKRLVVLSNEHNEALNKTPNIINQANIAAKESIALKEREIVLLSQSLKNAAPNATQITNPFTGQLEDIEAVRVSIIGLKNDIINLSTSANSIEKLTQQTKLLTDISKQLTVTEDGLKLSIGVEQWQRYINILKDVAPNVKQIGLDEFQTGEAGKIVNDVISQNNLTLENYRKTLKGSAEDINTFENNIKELKAAIETSLNNKITTVDFKGNKIEIDQAVRDYAQMSSTLKIIKQTISDTIGITSQLNAEDQQRVISLHQERLEIEEQLKSRSIGSSTVTLSNGDEVSIESAIQRRNELKIAEDNLTNTVKLRNLAITASEEGIDGLNAKAKLLTETLKSLNGKVTAEQFAEMRTNISSLVTGFDKFTLEEVNAGKATELLTKETFNANKAILDFNRSISGRNTLVGDYTKGIVDAFKQTGFTDVLQQQRVQLQNDLVQQTIKLSQLKQQYRDLGATAGEAYEKIKQEIIDVGKAQANTVAQIKNINVAFKESGTVGGGVANALTQGFDNLGRKILQTAGIYFGFQAAISGISRAIDIDKELTDKFADLQRILGTTKEGVDGIVESLRKIDTRTPINDLTGMAVVAAKAGVAEKDISGVAEAMNRLKLVVGKDFGGDIETATETVVKLVNIFIGPGKATADNISKISNALVTLDQEGVATADFVAKFAEEMSGVQGITKIGIPSVLGLGAAFQETGIRAEVSSTAISQILIRIGANIQKYAALANNVKLSDVTQSQVEAFRALLRDNPGESLIQLAVGLKKNKENFDEFGAAFADLGAKGFKVTSVFGDLADKADFFRQKIELARTALSDQNVIMEGATLKEENLAGVLDKIGAKFQLAFSNPQLLQTIKIIGEGVLTITNALLLIPFQAVLTGVAGVSAAYLAYKFNIGGAELAQRLFNKESATSRLISKAQELQIISEIDAETLRNRVMAASSIENKNLRASVQATIVQESLAEVSKQKLIAVQQIENSATATSTDIQKANAESKLATALADKSLTLATEGTTIATEELNAATAASPLGIILAVLGLLIPLMGTFGAKLDDTTQKIDEQNSKLSVNAELQKLIGESIGKSVTEVQNKAQLLINILKDERLSLDTRKAAYNELIKLSPEFVGAINNDAKSVADLKLDVNKLNISLQDLIANLNETATTAAFAQLKINAVGALTGIIQKQIETETEQKRLESDLTTFTTGEIKKRFNALTQEQVQSLKDIRAAQLRSELPGKVQSIQEIFTDQELARQKEDQDKLSETKSDVNKLKIERANQEQKTTATLNAVQEQINTLDSSLQEKTKKQVEVEKNITSIQTSVKDAEQNRLEHLKTAQSNVDRLNNEIYEATNGTSTKNVATLKIQLTTAETQVKQYSQLTHGEQVLNGLVEQDSKLKQEIVNKNKNISSLTNQQIEENKKSNEEAKIEVKTKDEAIKLLEEQRDHYNALIVNTIRQLESVDKNTAKARELNSHLGDLIKARNDINKKLKELGVSLSSKEGLSPQESSLLKFLEAEKDLELAEEEDRFAKIKAIRKATLDEETTHNKKMFEITEFWNGKMVNAIEGSNNAELLKKAQISKQTEDLELQTNQRILQDKQNQLDEDSRIERKHLDARKNQLIEELESIKQVTDITNEEVASSHRFNVDVLLTETLDGYQKLIIEAQKFGLSTELLEEERIKRVSEITKEGLQANKEIYDAYYQDISLTIKKQISTEIEAINKLRENVLNSSKSDFSKDQDLKQIDRLQKVVEAIDKVTEAERKYRSVQLESDIALRSTTRVHEDYLHSQIASNLAVDRMSVSLKGSNQVILSTVDDTKKLETETKNLATLTENIIKATREQANEQHDATVKAKEDLRVAIEELLGGVNDLGTVGGLAKEGIESLFHNLFKIDPKTVADAKAKGGQAWEDIQKDITKKTQGRKILGDVLASAFQTAQLAMETYFANERANIAKSKQAIEDRIDVENAQLKARSQSQAESDAIDRESAAKKKAAEKAAGEQEKKVKIQELKLAFALEIANIAASSARLIFPLNLIEFGALSALAYARYALSLSQVNSATFAKGIRLTVENIDNFATGGNVTKLFSKGGRLIKKIVNGKEVTEEEEDKFASGGQPDLVTTRGGRVKGRSHADGGNKFMFKGRIFEDEVDELNVIRTKNAPRGRKYSISGTQEQIASALNEIGGGVRFSIGADIKRLEFGSTLNSLGSTSSAFTLQAPNPTVLLGRPTEGNTKLEQNISALTNEVRSVSKKVDQTTENMNILAWQTNTRIDKIKVQVVAKEVVNTDNSTKKASSIGRLGK